MNPNAEEGPRPPKLRDPRDICLFDFLGEDGHWYICDLERAHGGRCAHGLIDEAIENAGDS